MNEIEETLGKYEVELDRADGVVEYGFRAVRSNTPDERYLVGVLVAYEGWGLTAADELFAILGVKKTVNHDAVRYRYSQYCKVKRVFEASGWHTRFQRESLRLRAIEID